MPPSGDGDEDPPGVAVGLLVVVNQGGDVRLRLVDELVGEPLQLVGQGLGPGALELLALGQLPLAGQFDPLRP